MENQQSHYPKDFFSQFKNKEKFHIVPRVAAVVTAVMERIKKVKTESLGDLALNIPRDRNSEFEPQSYARKFRQSSAFPHLYRKDNV